MNDKYEIYNPNNLPVEQLPFIFGFNNGGSPGFWCGTLLSEDGHYLGGHLCSDEWFMLGDLGILKGTRPDRHGVFRNHYPDGYRMDFISFNDTYTHELLNKAIEARTASIQKSIEE